MQIPKNVRDPQFTEVVTLTLPFLVVGVHCSHGLNRTGYFICRYMIDVLQIEPKTAIEHFQQARGHTIEKDDLINHLLNR